MTAATPTSLPLEGIRVVEFCWVWSGPMLGQHLADLGAEVIKVEWYSRHDLYRTRGVEHLRGKLPEATRRESSFAFASLNRNKRSFAVDMKDPEGIELVKQLLAKSDVLLENFTVGTMDRLGLDDAVLRSINEQLVVISLSATGQDSSIEALRGYGLMLSALGGFEAQLCDAHGEFVGSPSLVVSDPNAALFGVLGALAGVLYARRTNLGTTFECSQVEAVTSIVAAPPPPKHPWHDVTVATNDGHHLAVSVPDAKASELADMQLSTMSAAAASAAVEALGGYAAPIRPLEDTISSPEFAGLPTHQSCTHPVGGEQQLVSSPWLTDGERAPIRRPAPVLGADNDYVLREVIGMPAAEAAAVAASAALREPDDER